MSELVSSHTIAANVPSDPTTPHTVLTRDGGVSGDPAVAAFHATCESHSDVSVDGVAGVMGVMGPFDPGNGNRRLASMDGEESTPALFTPPSGASPLPDSLVVETTDTSGTRISAGSPIRGSIRDYPVPTAITNEEVFVWDEDVPIVENFRDLGLRLVAGGDLYRVPSYAGGLVFAPALSGIEFLPIDTPQQLAPLIADRIRVEVRKAGKVQSRLIPERYLRLMLRSEAFLQQFQSVDLVTSLPLYLNDFRISAPGYNDGGTGHRVLYRGGPASVEQTPEAISRFLDAMPFATNGDRTNALAFALTVQLAHLWPGEKPLFPVTGTKSHSGKDTLVKFAAGSSKAVSISYQSPDWPIERSVVGLIKQSPDLKLICVENARTEKQAGRIASAFIERFVTDPRPFLFSTGTGCPVHLPNRFVVAISTNYGTLSEDLANRSCPIHLAPRGNIEDRRTQIGNPKLEFLPQNRERIEAELRGMIERWKTSGRPRSAAVHHPCINWAQTIGGILEVNGYRDFLSNYSRRRSTDEPLRRALSMLGASRPDEWRSSSDWAKTSEELGLVNAIIPQADRGSVQGRARGIGVVLTNHRDERLFGETEDDECELLLRKRRSRFGGGQPSTRYCFELVKRTPLPTDSDNEDAGPRHDSTNGPTAFPPG